MESLNNQYGFDEEFVDKPPELYRCIVCQLVLRNPMLILKCGHRFCTPCLERFKDHSEQTQTELRCPVDRDLIDLTKICEDHGLRRAVGSLVVKCGAWEKGCVWQGELSELQHHSNICEHQPQSCTAPLAPKVEDLISLVRILQGRLETLEHKFEEKEKEAAHWKHRMRSMEEGSDNNRKEIDILKKKNNESESELAMLQKKYESLTEKNVMFEQEFEKVKIKYDEKFRLSEREMLQLRGQSDQAMKELGLLKEKELMPSQGMKELMQKYDKKFKSLEDKVFLMNNKAKYTELAMGDVEVMKGESATFQRKHLPKKILLTQFRGNPKITVDNHVLLPNGSWSTVVASDGGIPVREKGFYEVIFEVGDGSCRVGWATETYLTARNDVGDCPNSYGFNAMYRCKFNNKQSDDWGVKVTPESAGVIGVAIDVESREILFGANGNWEFPMGVAFHNIKNNRKYFPAISGRNVKFSVNFGQVDFKFGPPDQSFKKLIDL